MLEIFVLALVVIGLGAMVYFLNKATKEAHKKRAEFAEQKGWVYKPVTSRLVWNVPFNDRNIRYRMEGTASDGTPWEITARYHKKIDSKSKTRNTTTSRELLPSTEMVLQKPFDGNFLIMQSAGFNIPGFAMGEIFSRLGFPSNVPRLKDEELPKELAGNFDVYSEDPGNIKQIEAIAPGLLEWGEKYPRDKKGIALAATAQGCKLRVEWSLEKPEDIEAFVNTGNKLLA